MHRLVLALVITALSFSFLCGQTQGNTKDSVHTTSARIFPLPILFYTPETGVAGGAAALLVYRDPFAPRASSVTADLIYTEKKQIVIELSGDQYFGQGGYRLLSDIKFQKYPNKFFGTGNATASVDEENYTQTSFRVKASLYAGIFPRVNAGPVIHYETVSMSDVEPGKFISSSTIAGRSGGVSSGLGFVANWDSRDNTFAAFSGSFYQVTALFYQRAFGSNYNYSALQFDFRNFFEVTPGHVLALKASGDFTGGDVPFQNLARFGGQDFLRGYFDGRYRDYHAAGIQAEYRLPVWWRFGLVGFAGVAQVANRISQFGLGRFWFAGGAGIRFAWNPEERVNLRLDYGIGNNSDGIYITMTEAF
ncbi:MAG: BamA/TamA family outer membrane protein [Ignavibacteriales bacterium]|nr:BamA/TamA family outer membrane protein [Ignavibacteriales bacterium]